MGDALLLYGLVSWGGDADARMLDRFGLPASTPEPRIVREILLVLGAHYAPETREVLEDLNQEWLGEGWEKRWFGMGLELATIAGVLARVNPATVPANLGAVCKELHHSPPRKGAESRLAFVLLCLPERLREELWGHREEYYTVSLRVFIDDWRPKLRPYLATYP